MIQASRTLYLRLEQEFPGESLFMDVEGHIKPGDDFVAVLSEQVAQCDVLLVIEPVIKDLRTSCGFESDRNA
jgi:hypothetical protein